MINTTSQMAIVGQKKFFIRLSEAKRAGRSFKMEMKMPASSGEMIMERISQPNPLRLRRTLANMPTAIENAIQKKKNAILFPRQTAARPAPAGMDRAA
jgi:hypothetical protein